MTTLADLITMAAADNSVLEDEVTGSMCREAVAARFQVCWVLRRSGWSLPAIGRTLGRDHSSVANAVARATVRRWMLGVRVAPESVRAGGPLVETSGPVVSAGEDRASLDTVTVAADGNYLMQGSGATTGSTDNCIEGETDAATTRTCVDCDDPAMPGGVIRCERHLLEDLDRRVRAKPRPKKFGPRESNACRQVSSPGWFTRGAA